MKVVRLKNDGTWETFECEQDGAVGVVLTKKDKANIANMHPDSTCYLAFAGGFPRADAERLADALKAQVHP